MLAGVAACRKWVCSNGRAKQGGTTQVPTCFLLRGVHWRPRHRRIALRHQVLVHDAALHMPPYQQHVPAVLQAGGRFRALRPPRCPARTVSWPGRLSAAAFSSDAHVQAPCPVRGVAESSCPGALPGVRAGDPAGVVTGCRPAAGAAAWGGGNAGGGAGRGGEGSCPVGLCRSQSQADLRRRHGRNPRSVQRGRKHAPRG